MDKKARLATSFDLQRPDRPPILGGWLAAPNHIQALTGCPEDDYWSDPFYWGLEAERVLGSDGVVDIFVPIARGEYRNVDKQTVEARAKYTIESVLAEIDTMPDVDEIEDAFDEEREYQAFAASLQERQQQCGDLLWCAPAWGLIPKALWRGKFGYENALMTLGLHPDRYCKLIQASAQRGRHGEFAFPIIASMLSGRNDLIPAVNIRNDGLIGNLPDWAVVEVPAIAMAAGLRGVQVGDLPRGIAALCNTQIGVQDRVVEAAVHGSRRLALEALMIDPVVDSAVAAERVLDELLEAQAPYLPRFHR